MYFGVLLLIKLASSFRALESKAACLSLVKLEYAACLSLHGSAY